jgi:GxxExxY protein
MDINSLTGTILDLCIKIHTKIGPGCFERVYEEVLYYELVQRNILIERQLLMPIAYDRLNIPDAYRIDLLVEKQLVVEIKALGSCPF